ncbi:acetyltransferase-like isoleucine patch superfamily enzyme [Mumia flava]|uniref:Acetyltransferase-like isoleucine patch superfamily enzyme n=1 Tax=Mumia flava TaxID=1348852 RepID=A0A0B2BW44_9ACTN|nr:acyltransferase [Mumia flava]PJJ54159.1 acetyltransferase-like isoleucine patch superfamily enzyme [Mumia flava]
MSAPRQARFLTRDSWRWVRRHRAWTPYHLVRYWRFWRFRRRHPDVITEGFVFLGRDVQIETKTPYGRIVLGAFVHLGDRTALRAHNGTLRLGDKVVMGSDNIVNAHLDIEIGAATIVSDWTYICDFDHVTLDLERPIKDQGLVVAPVRIGPDSWIGVKASVLRGTTTGRGVVLAAHTVARGDYPDYAIVAGLPGRVVKSRRDDAAEWAEIQRYTAEVAAEQAEARETFG